MTPGWFHIYYVGKDGQERAWLSAESIPKLLDLIEAAQGDGSLPDSPTLQHNPQLSENNHE